MTTTPALPGSALAPPVPSGPPALMPHQQLVYDFLVSRPFGAAWLGIGSGKTLTTLSVLQAVRPAGHILVIAPSAIARSTWINEIEKWGFPMRTRSLIVDERDRKLSKQKRLERFREVFTDPPTMYFINRELLTRSPMTSCQVCHGAPPKSVPACRACQSGLIDQLPSQEVQDARGRKHLVPIWPFPTVIIDEAQGFASPSSKRFEALAAMRPAITRLIELTGSPIPNGLHDLWSQMYLLDQGQALGENITAYRDRWFLPKMVYGTTIPAKWLPVDGASTEIYRRIAHLAISAQPQGLNLEEPLLEDVEVVLPADVLESYQEFKQELVLDLVRTHLDEHGQLSQSIESIVADNQAVLTGKLQQFASGTLYSGDPDDPSQKGQYEVIHEAKLDMVEYLVRNNGGEPVLIPYHFRSDLEQLLKRFQKAGIDARAFDGSRAMNAAWNRQEIPVMLLHPASAGHGLNLQDGGTTLIWYTLPFSLEHYQQTNGRLHRKGQTKQVRIVRLLAKGTQDQRMPALLEEKAQTQNHLLDAVDATPMLLAELGEDLAEFRDLTVAHQT